MRAGTTRPRFLLVLGDIQPSVPLWHAGRVSQVGKSTAAVSEESEPTEPRLRIVKGRPWVISGSRRARWSSEAFVSKHAVEIRQVGDPVLHAPAKKPKLSRTAMEDLVARMFASMVAARGIGVAASQIGVALRIAILDVDEAGIVAVDPKVEWTSEDVEESSEGCLSVRGLYAMLERPVGARLNALDITGKRFKLEGVELGAQCMLHETDHLDGKLYVDRLRSRADLRPVEPEQDETTEDPAASLSGGAPAPGPSGHELE